MQPRPVNKYRLKLVTTFKESVGRAKNFGAFKSSERCKITMNRFYRYGFLKRSNDATN